MRKSSVFIPLISIIAGVLGFYIRRIELNTVFDSSGLAVINAPVSMVLNGLSAIFCLFAFIFAIITGTRYKACASFVRAFNSSGFLLLALNFLAGIVIIAASFLCFAEFRMYEMKTMYVLFTAFAFLSGVSFIVLSVAAYKGRESSSVGVFSVMPSVFACVWLVMTYKDHISDPVLLNYAYPCLALSAAALSFYYGSGFAFRRSNTTKTVFSYMATVFFCAVVFADGNSLPFRMMLLAIIMVQLLNLAEFLKNLRIKN